MMEFSEPTPKRRRPNGFSLSLEEPDSSDNQDTAEENTCGKKLNTTFSPNGDAKDKNITATSAASARSADETVAPFLMRHIPDQYAPLGSTHSTNKQPSVDPNSRYCYRHRPDRLCRRQADEPSMDRLQRDLDTLSQDDRQGISHVWSLFSAAPSKHRNLMLQGILAQCCFPQLSQVSASVRDLLKIDFISALPAEVSFRILCFLDTISLCKAAQVSQRWRQLADDDVVWHRMCEQHIDRKCTKCGWGLPAMEQKRLRASKRQNQLRAAGRGISDWSPNITPNPESHEDTEKNEPESREPGKLGVRAQTETKDCPATSLAAVSTPCIALTNDSFAPARPWKDVYKDRFRIGSNWKYGRCSTKIFRGHTNGIMCLQFVDNILATGSYDATIKIWDMDTGAETRTLSGHLEGIRCLQFDTTKLISGSLDGTLKVWNWRTGECLSTHVGHNEGVIGLHFDGDLLASASVDKTIKIWNFRDRSKKSLRGHTDWVNAVKLDLVSRTVFSASDDLTIRLWDLDTSKCICILKGHVGQVQQIVPLPRDFELDDAEPETGSCSPGSRTDSEQASSLHTSSPAPPATDSCYAKVFNSETDRIAPPKYILSSALDSTIRLWEVPTGRCVKTFFGHVEGVWGLAADALRVVSGAEDHMVKVWDARSGNCEKTYTGHAGPVTCIGLSDSCMCTGSEDGEVRRYCFENGSPSVA